MVDKATNAGVHASTGFELQKHCALFIILERFDELKDKEYFVCIEHSDDVIFGFFDKKNLKKIEAYQVKKSSTIWSINEKWREIIRGILNTGKTLTDDTFPKTDDYSHKISFLSNQTSTLKVMKKNVISEKGDVKDNSIISNIDEANSSVAFYSLPNEIHEKIEKDLALHDHKLTNELKNLFFEYIDLNKNVKEQKNCLRGKCSEVFSDKIADPEAAINTIMKVFRKVEHEFNQGNKTNMLDEKKRVYSREINLAFDIITTKSIAYELWREQKKELGKGLEIPISQRENFKVQFDNSIDFFKDLSQAEHQKIFKFVEENRDMLDQFYVESECIIGLYNKFKNKHNCNLDDLVIKATIFAAYIKIGGIV